MLDFNNQSHHDGVLTRTIENIINIYSSFARSRLF